MFCLDSFATGHLGISSSRHSNFELAVFDLDLRLGYLCNFRTMALNDVLLFNFCKLKTGSFILSFGLNVCTKRRPAAPKVPQDAFLEIFLSAASCDVLPFAHLRRQIRK